VTFRRDLIDVRAVRPSPVVRADARPDPNARTSASERPSAPDDIGSSQTDSSGAPEVILLKVGFKQVATRVREMVFAESARNYVRIHLENGNVLKSRVPIDRLAQHLGADRFLRIHRGRLVNMERIRSVAALAGGRLQLTLNQGSTIIVARDRRRAVLAQIGAIAERRPPVTTPPRPVSALRPQVR
jgi:two-component system LytT family response regulator